MPANLSQQYRNAEKKYRRASNPQEELACLELMLREIPKHKGTDKMQADLKRRISQTRAMVREQTGKPSTTGFRIPRQGAARVVIVGGPNSGKSSLFNCLTQSEAEVAEYPFTTTQPSPGLLRWQEIKVQLVDTPPVMPGELDPRTESLVRGADLVLILLNAGDDNGADIFSEMLTTFQNSSTRLARENGIDKSNIGVTLTRTELVWTGADINGFLDRVVLFTDYLGGRLPEFMRPGLQVSSISAEGLDALRSRIIDKLELIRVYTRNPADKEVDRSEPVVLPAGSTVLELAAELHEELAANFHQARIWGDGKHDGTVVNGEYELEDQDVVEIRTR